MMTLKDKLKDELNQGNFALSSKDLEAQDDKGTGADIQGDVTVPVAPAAKKDLVVGNQDAKGPADALKTQTDQPTERVALVDLPVETVVLTEQDREAFLAALVSGKRFQLPFSLFGGKIQGVFRCRSQGESHAVISQINRELQKEQLYSMMDYATRLRAMLLAAQVEELNGEHYAVLQEPHLAVRTSVTETTEPGWLGQAKQWEGRDEGLVIALYKELQIFEKKYWTLIDNAKDQDFWKPAGSTSA